MTQEDAARFEVFYRENFEKLVGYAYRFLKNWDDAKEVTQEAFLTALIRIDRFHASKNQQGWIKSAIRKKAQNLNKTKAIRSQAIVSVNETAPFAAEYDRYSNVDTPFAHCAELLGEQEFLLIKRIFGEGETYRDVAGEFGMTEGACRKRVERIIKKLREQWDEER